MPPAAAAVQARGGQAHLGQHGSPPTITAILTRGEGGAASAARGLSRVVPLAQAARLGDAHTHLQRPAAAPEQRLPWEAELRRSWTGMLGDNAEAARALQLTAHALAPSSVGTYTYHWRTFVRFCERRGLCSLPASTATVARYVAWQSMRGKVQPQFFQPYLSAINTAHRDVFGDEAARPGVGPIIKAIRAGWLREHLRAPGVQREVSVALPAAAARLALRALLEADVAALLARALSFLVLSFATLMRASSAVPLARRDMVISDAATAVRPRVLKGGQLRVVKPSIKLFPNAPASLYMFQLVQRWQRVQAAAWRTASRTQPSEEAARSFWALPGDGAGGVTTVAQEWISLALDHVGVVAPLGVKYTTKCNRKGGASAAHAEGVSLGSIRHLGDWAPNSTTPEKHYIDFSVVRDTHSRFFFGFRVGDPIFRLAAGFSY